MKAKKWDEGMAGSGILYNEEASQQRSEIPPGPEEKTQEEFRLIGGMTPRIDGNEIVTGKAKFTHDIRLRGMLHGKILRSPHARAEIEAVDLSAARSLPGVKAAIRLAEKSIRYAGEEVAAVAAVEEKTAEKALGLIRVSYRPLPHAVTEERAREEDAPRVFEDQPNLRSFNTYERGDVDAGFREADAVIERTYRTAVEIHQTAETHVSIAAWDEDRLTVWDSTQAVHSVRDQLARALQVPASRIRVIKTYMGGGFGSKLGLNVHTLAAALLAREARRPVKIMLTRQENSVCVGNRPSTIQTLKGGVTRDGRLTALTMKNLTCGGLRRGDRCSEPLIDLHRCPNVRVEEISIATHTGPARPTRAPGQVQGTFALEGFLDELAAEIGMDPLELRRRNYSTKNRGDTGVPYSTKGLDRCYELGAEAIGWERRNMPPGAGIGRFRRGIGMASQIWWGA
ncbi:MAG: xanthine dehydrogenase family protein molybdopterin-binding subunit, partial [Candidatus Aminicenantales bacterium]